MFKIIPLIYTIVLGQTFLHIFTCLNLLDSVEAVQFDRNAPFLMLHKAFGGFNEKNEDEDDHDEEDENYPKKKAKKDKMNECRCATAKQLAVELEKCRIELNRRQADPDDFEISTK